MTPHHVLVTGGSGFIAGHCILQLLEQGHRVRTTIRSLDREGQARDALTQAGMASGADLQFVAADLTNDTGWREAVDGIDAVLHVASPVAPGHVENEDELIVPAREGALRVLRAALDAAVPRVVLTSAFHAVSWGHPHTDHVFTEADWTVLDGPGVDAYGKSKTLAERAAWDFVAEHGAPELVTMLPVAVMGPVIGTAITGSNHIIQRMLDGAMPVLPNLYIPIVDVRDVAAAHILAMHEPVAAGERFLLSAGPVMSMKQIAQVLRENLGEGAKKVPTRGLPDVVARVGARFNPELRSIAPDLGYQKRLSNDMARKVLRWTPHSSNGAIVAAGQSMLDRGLAGA